MLLVDEVQDVAAGHLPVLAETLSHAAHPRSIFTGTPKLIDNPLEGVFSESTANEWTISCIGCGHDAILDERALGPSGLICSACHGPIDPRLGRWVPRNPTSIWGDGFWIGAPMVPWLRYASILDKQRSYDPAKFKNEVLGLAVSTGEYAVTRAELEACCGTRPMARQRADLPPGHSALIAGIDWGGGGKRGTSLTVLVLGYLDAKRKFHVCRFERFRASEEPERVLAEIATRCRDFGVEYIAADGAGNGVVLNRLLLDRVRCQALCGISYGLSDQPPHREGVLHQWMVNRTGTIGHLMSCIKKQLIEFPMVSDCHSFLDEFTCEIAEFDNATRTIKYTHPQNLRDDALHSANYALTLAGRLCSESASWFR